MRQIPLDRLFDTVCEFCLRQPPQLPVDLRRIDGIAAVVAFAILHIRDEALRFSQRFADELHDIDISHLIMPADIVHLAHASMLQDEIDGLMENAVSLLQSL